jgi:heme-degrading monooxygenase HmoA
MIAEYVRYRITADQQPAFEQAYAEAEEALRASPHCLGYELAHCVEEPERYILRIEWDSLEGHMQGFRASAEFRRFVGHIRGYVPLIEEMHHYEPTDVRGASAEPPP